MSVDMDTVELDSILDDCLERMRRGEELESCLATYPDHAEELQSLLIVATDMTQFEVPRTGQQAAEAGRQRMFAAIEAGQSKVTKNNQTISVSIVGIIRYLEQVQNTFISNLSKEFLVMHKTVIAIVLVLVVVFGGSAASAYAAQGSLPGDALYPMKTAIENASVDFSVDSASEVRLYLSLAEKRIVEIESLAAEGRYDDMEKAVERFESHVEKAIKGLLVVAQGNPAEARTLAALLGNLMERHTQVLLALMVTSPDGVQATFEDAVEASQEGISAAEEFAGDGEANENSSPEEEDLANVNESDEDENGSLNDNEEEGYANESEDEDSSDDENSNENGEDVSEDENTGDEDEDEGNLNGDDDDGEDDDEGNLNGDDDDDEDEDENVNGDDDDEDQNTNGDDDGESEDENTNGDDDSAENSNENNGEDENANGDDKSNENGDTGEEEDGINENGDDSSEDDSTDAYENDNTGEDDDSSDGGDGSGNENDSSEDETHENDNGSEDESNENDNSVSEVDDGEIDNSEQNENSNS